MALNSKARLLLKRLVPVQKVVWSGRLCTNPPLPAETSANVPTSATRIIPTTFSNGLFRFKYGNETYVLHFWTPVTQIPEVMRSVADPAATSDPLTSAQDEVAETTATPPPAVRIFDVVNNPVDLGANPVALGHALSESSTVLIEGMEQQPLRLQLEGMVDPLRKWEAAEVPPKSYEDQMLMKEKQVLLSSYQPMSAEFTQILSQAESQAHTRFKWGGLFFLSAQLGFVARLTWFEYSWDIMEPITWCITYSLMISTFAYYVMTSQEFLLPLAEKREVRERFWKIAQKKNFNVQEFKRLRKQLLELERRTSQTAGGSQTAFDRVMRSIQV